MYTASSLLKRETLLFSEDDYSTFPKSIPTQLLFLALPLPLPVLSSVRTCIWSDTDVWVIVVWRWACRSYFRNDAQGYSLSLWDPAAIEVRCLPFLCWPCAQRHLPSYCWCWKRTRRLSVFPTRHCTASCWCDWLGSVESERLWLGLSAMSQAVVLLS